MSTLNSYFRTRSSRTPVKGNEKIASADSSPSKGFAAQAPEPIYEALPKQSQSNNTQKSQSQSQSNRNSILHYLSPVKKSVLKEEEEDQPVPCRVRQNTPVAQLWNVILEEFDPHSQINQLELSINNSEKADVTINDILMSDNRRRKVEQQSTTRNVRIRKTSSISQFCRDDYHFLENVEEALSRPLRVKQTFKQSNDFLLEITDDFSE